MPRWRSVWLVARREMLERGRSRGFILSVAFTTIDRGRLVRRPGHPVRRRAGDQGRRSSSRRRRPSAAAIEATAERFDRNVAITTYPDAAAADAALADGQVDVVVPFPADLSSPGEIRFEEETDPGIAQIISAATIGLRVQAVLGESNVDQTALAAAQQPPTVEALEPQTEDDQGRFLVANIGAVLILVGIFSFGFTVLTGVVEEKQSRVVEVVLVHRSAARPADGQGPRASACSASSSWSCSWSPRSSRRSSPTA